jgi:hypothetical protein
MAAIRQRPTRKSSCWFIEFPFSSWSILVKSARYVLISALRFLNIPDKLYTVGK